MTTTYAVKVGKQTRFKFIANLAEASAPIEYLDDDGLPSGTPFQSADARHNPVKAASLLIGWCRSQGGEDVAAHETITVEAIDE